MPTCRQATSPRVVLEAKEAAPYMVTTRAHSSVAMAHWLGRWCAPEPRARTKAPLSTTIPTQYAGGSVCTRPRSLLIGSVTDRAASAARRAASSPTTTYGAPAHRRGEWARMVTRSISWALVIVCHSPDETDGTDAGHDGAGAEAAEPPRRHRRGSCPGDRDGHRGQGDAQQSVDGDRLAQQGPETADRVVALDHGVRDEPDRKQPQRTGGGLGVAGPHQVQQRVGQDDHHHGDAGAHEQGPAQARARAAGEPTGVLDPL